MCEQILVAKQQPPAIVVSIKGVLKKKPLVVLYFLVAVVVSAAVLVAVFKSMKLFALRSVASTSAVCCAEPGTARRITINRFVFS